MDKIVCLGKNYSEHAKELGEKQPEKPVLFLKPPSVLKCGENPNETLKLYLPKGRGQVHHECEIVLRVGENLTIEAVTVGLDMTLRDVQSELKKKGQPWTTSKVFVDSAVIAPWKKVGEFPDWDKEEFQFSINGSLKQKGMASQMLLRVTDCIDYCRKFFPVYPGDLIFTGTPAGVGPVQSGDKGQLSWGEIELRVQWE